MIIDPEPAAASISSLEGRTLDADARTREDMVAVVSHDLRNPLATIQMAVRVTYT